ncbi:MAG TPA: glycoside hydrolase family 57 protein [Candidatus Acidoferrales bacterium]|nr:glycoside hydrolase family 57 protein [Candidatus Acidoferrales bacterium]
MSGVNLVILWHMHQPQYRDPSTGRYLLPWTRLHALKDYWGMVRVLQEFPSIHATFNFVPLLAAQIDEYASGNFKEAWFEIAFAPADSLTPDQKRAALERAFQVNDNYLRRWPRFAEIHSHWRSSGAEGCAAHFAPRDWRDLQVLSQLAWMDEEYITHDPVVNALSAKGANFTEDEKQALRDKQLELLAAVLPEYRLAESRGQIEISTTPYYHPILPLLCDSDIARVSNPHTPLPHPAFRYPEDAREQLVRARRLHERFFGKPPAGLWPSEGSVSDQGLEIAMDLGFRWFATDEGVLGRTRNEGFWRDPQGYPENGADLYTPWRLRRGERELTGFFRDHYISDLVGFVYSRMGTEAAADDFYRRIRAVGDRAPAGRTPTLSVILDGENAWEFYPENGRAFLRAFYRRIESDHSIRALTASEALESEPNAPVLQGIFPASWINANFDVWIGHAEDVRAWDLLRDAREAYALAVQRGVPPAQLARAYEAVLAAEGSDWTWWFGPEHGSSNDAEFDALFRKHLSEIYAAIGEHGPDALAHPIKRAPEHGRRESPSAYLTVAVDGRETTYFEWMGAGLYSADRGSGAMHGRICAFDEISYGFDPTNFYLRVDPLAEAVADMRDFQLRITIWDSRETRITLRIQDRALCQCVLEQGGVCLLHPENLLQARYGSILELGLSRDLFDLRQRRELLLSVALWEGGLPLDVLPAEGMLNISLGDENFAWPISP